MAQLFPKSHVMGFIFSLVLTVVAMAVYFYDMSFTVAMIILLATAFIQAGVQVVMFMHAGESEDRGSIYTHVWYSVFFAIVTILGTILCMTWAYQYPGV